MIWEELSVCPVANRLLLEAYPKDTIVLIIFYFKVFGNVGQISPLHSAQSVSVTVSFCEQNGHKSQQKQDYLMQVYQLLGGFRVSNI